MSVKKESGRRWVQVEVEVHGTPEEVWQALATGPGISSWFVATEVRDDDTIVVRLGRRALPHEMRNRRGAFKT